MRLGKNNNLIEGVFMSKTMRLMANKWFVLLANTVFFIIMAIVLPIHFETNDDVTMCEIANGRFSGRPDAHLVFINALLGWLLAALYRMTCIVEWYTLVLCVLHVVAFTGVVYFIINDSRIHKLLKLLLILFVYVLWIRMIVGFQFTTTAGALCCCGCMALLQPSKKCKVLGVAFVLIASLVRFSAAGLVGLLFAPFFVMFFLKDRKYVIWLIVVLVTVLSGKMADKGFYQDDNWAKYMEYNHLRSVVQDNPKGKEVLYHLPQGIVKEDYELFVWFIGDPQVITTEMLKVVKGTMHEDGYLDNLTSNLDGLVKYRVSLFFLCIGFLIGIFMNVKQKRTVWAWVLCGELILFSLILLGISMNWIVKERVFLCMLLPTVYVLVSALPDRMSPHLILFSSIMVGLASKYIYQDYKLIGAVREGREYVEKYQIPLVAGREEKVFSIEFWEQYLPPFGIMDLDYNVRGLGWSAMSPLNKGILESHLDLADSTWVILTRLDDPPIKIGNAIERNYGKKVAIKLINYNEKYAIYKFETE